MVATRGGNAHERLGHEARNEAVLARHLGADLAVGRQPVAVPQDIVEHPVELELPGCVLVVTLNHIEPHGFRVRHDLHERGAQLFELVDVIAIRLGDAAIGAAVRAAFQPHHFRLGARSQMQTVVILLELVVDNA